MRKLILAGSVLAIVAPVMLSASSVISVVLQSSAGLGFYCLSNLGVSQIPYVAYLFNVPLMITGMAVVVFTIALTKAIRCGKLFLAGAGTMVVSSIFVSLVGVFTTANRTLHDFVSTGQFILFSVSVILIGISFVRKGIRREGYVSIATSIVTAIVGVFAESGPFFRAHACAAGEWTFALGLSAWFIWMGRSLPNL